MSYAKGSYVRQGGPNSLKKIYGNTYPLSKPLEWSSHIYTITPVQMSSGITYPTPIETNWSSRDGRWISPKIVPYTSISEWQNR